MTKRTVVSLTLLTAFTLFVAAGCTGGSDDSTADSGTDTPATTDETSGHGHSHASEGPHHGQLIELGGEEYHAEFVHDDKAGTVTIYILDGNAKEVVPIEASEIMINLKHDGMGEQFKLMASPDEDDPEGKSSRFISNDEELGEDLEHKDADAQLVLTIAGKSYRGKIDHGHSHAHGGGHSHSHAGGDALVWRKDVELSGYAIRLGHHGKHLHAGKPVEPAISITRDGKPASDAKVFNSLVAEDKETITAKEMATVYEPTTADEPAHYAQGALTIPKDVSSIIIRYRIVLPGDAGNKTYDVPVDVE